MFLESVVSLIGANTHYKNVVWREKGAGSRAHWQTVVTWQVGHRSHDEKEKKEDQQTTITRTSHSQIGSREY